MTLFTADGGRRTAAGSLLDAAIQGFATGVKEPMRNGNTTILGKRTTKAVQTYKAKLLAWSPNYLDSERVLVLMLYAFEEGYFFGANAARNPTIFP